VGFEISECREERRYDTEEDEEDSRQENSGPKRSGVWRGGRVVSPPPYFATTTGWTFGFGPP
jgi:hypothetical protein